MTIRRVEDKIFTNFDVKFDPGFVCENASEADTVVMVNGCFDLLHRGHLLFLEKASNIGDFLVVAINSDESIRKIKPGRPVQDEDTRAEILASLEIVDNVVIFEEETPEKILEAIDPDIFVCGLEHQNVEWLQKYLEKIVFFPRIGEDSTSNVIKKILPQE